MTNGFSLVPTRGSFPVPLQAPQVVPFRAPVPPHSGQSPVSPDINEAYMPILL